MSPINDDNLAIFAIVSLLMLPALTIGMFQKWPYLWWLLWTLSLSLSLYIIFDAPVPGNDSDTNLSRAIGHAFSFTLFFSNFLSFLLFQFRSKIRILIDNIFLRIFVIYVSAMGLYFLIGVPIARMLKI